MTTNSRLKTPKFLAFAELLNAVATSISGKRIAENHSCLSAGLIPNFYTAILFYGNKSQNVVMNNRKRKIPS